MRGDFGIKADVVDALEKVDGPDGKDIVAGGLVGKVEVENAKVRVTLVVADDTPKKTRFDVEDAVYDALEAVEGVADSLVVPTSSTPTTAPGDAEPAAGGPKKGLRLHGPGAGAPAQPSSGTAA